LGGAAAVIAAVDGVDVLSPLRMQYQRNRHL
jgi:hypothetical protein